MLRHQLAVAERQRPRAHMRPDVAGPGVTGAARGDGAGRAPGGDAADRRSRHDRALAPGPRAPPLGAGHAGAAPGARRRIARCGRRCCDWPGERVVGITADPRRACRAWPHRGAVRGLADPQGRRHQPGSAPGWPGLGGVRLAAGWFSQHGRTQISQIGTQLVASIKSHIVKQADILRSRVWGS
jgi:hypothetical protein